MTQSAGDLKVLANQREVPKRSRMQWVQSGMFDFTSTKSLQGFGVVLVIDGKLIQKSITNNDFTELRNQT